MDATTLKKGDHICGLYSSRGELAEIVADFVVDGLRRKHQCWFITSGDETEDVREALAERGVAVSREISRGALQLISGDGTYLVHGAFDPEQAIKTFNDAIDKAYRDGFTGFRAAAEMSWALARADIASQLIVYEALLKALFASARATGLCLYHRDRTPLAVVDGALATHPVVHSAGAYQANPFYDESVAGLMPFDAGMVDAKLTALGRARRRLDT